jgi:hypothetical protein
MPDGEYVRAEAKPDVPLHRVQRELLHAGRASIDDASDSTTPTKLEFVPADGDGMPLDKKRKSEKKIKAKAK